MRATHTLLQSGGVKIGKIENLRFVGDFHPSTVYQNSIDKNYTFKINANTEGKVAKPLFNNVLKRNLHKYTRKYYMST
jgi:hypothetical protein